MIQEIKDTLQELNISLLNYDVEEAYTEKEGGVGITILYPKKCPEYQDTLIAVQGPSYVIYHFLEKKLFCIIKKNAPRNKIIARVELKD